MTHWAQKYIGGKYVIGESDCWAFFRRLQSEQWGRQIPDVPIDIESARSIVDELERERSDLSRWSPVSEPRDGDAVLLGRGRRPIHIGTYVDIDESGGVLHALEGIGVVYTPWHRLDASGWPRHWIYRYAGNN